MRLRLFLILVALCDIAQAGFFRADLLFGFHLPGGAITSDNPNLQSGLDTRNNKAEISYYFGEDRGLLVGAGLGKQVTNYEQVRNDQRPSGYFSSRIDYRFIKWGYWIVIGDGDQTLEGSIIFGQENMDFYESTNNTSIVLSNFDYRAIDIRHNIPLPVEDVRKHLDFVYGLDVHFLRVPNFRLNNINYGAEDFAPDASLFFGLSVKF